MSFFKKLFGGGENENKAPSFGVPKNIDDLQQIFSAARLDHYFNQIKPLVKNKIDLLAEPAEEHHFSLGESKIGGQPHLPNSLAWPKTEAGKSMSFIAQFNLQKMVACDSSNLLPKQGLLSFFYCADQEAWGFDHKDKQRFKVLYTEIIDSLQKIDYPDDLDEYSVFNPNRVVGSNSLSLPDWDNDAIKGLIADADFERYEQINNISENQLLGYPYCIQGPMELECQLVTNGLYCGDSSGYNDPKAKLLEQDAKDWVLLFQIGSEEEKTGMMWGDAGMLYYWIRKQDLENKDFDKAWFVLQCH